MCSFKVMVEKKKEKSAEKEDRGRRAGILMAFKEKNLILDTTGFSTSFILKIRDKGPELQMFLDFALL